MSIQRWRQVKWDFAKMEASDKGKYVRYRDYKESVEHLLKITRAVSRKDPLITAIIKELEGMQ